MDKRYLFVKQDVYEKYIYKGNKQNQIRKFWLEIMGNMSMQIKVEVKGKPTDLILQRKGEFSITGAIPYQFETRNGSKELKEYLDQFAVFVEHDTEEIHKWREDIGNLLSSYKD